MRWLFSVRTQLIVALALCILGTLAGGWFLAGRQHTWQHWLAFWLLAANVVAFAYYGLDKYLARRVVILRIPEFVLQTLAAVGASPSALLAMWLFRHKTIKSSFRVLFFCILAVQLALTAYVVK